MVTVRFNTGYTLRYENGNFVSTGETYHELLDKEDGELLAMIPTTAIIEWPEAKLADEIAPPIQGQS